MSGCSGAEPIGQAWWPPDIFNEVGGWLNAMVKEYSYKNPIQGT